MRRDDGQADGIHIAVRLGEVEHEAMFGIFALCLLDLARDGRPLRAVMRLQLLQHGGARGVRLHGQPGPAQRGIAQLQRRAHMHLQVQDAGCLDALHHDHVRAMALGQRHRDAEAIGHFAHQRQRGCGNAGVGDGRMAQHQHGGAHAQPVRRLARHQVAQLRQRLAQPPHGGLGQAGQAGNLAGAQVLLLGIEAAQDLQAARQRGDEHRVLFGHGGFAASRRLGIFHAYTFSRTSLDLRTNPAQNNSQSDLSIRQVNYKTVVSSVV